jgi:hypothetical protein
MPPIVVLDTSVLFPLTLRDTLLGCAEQGLFAPRWSDEILDELRRNLIRDARVRQGRNNQDVKDCARSADRLILQMNRFFPESLVANYEAHIPFMTNHNKDRHVLAVAVHAVAGTIVTSNLKHVPPDALDPHRIIAQSPDEFLCSLLRTGSQTIGQVLRQLANDYRSPPLLLGQVLTSLATNAPTFAGRMYPYLLESEL